MNGLAWPTERQWVTIGIFALVVVLLAMAAVNPALWDVEVFKVIIQAVVLTGLLNMILAFHFAANKSDETKVENTGKAFEAITATANASNVTTADAASKAADKVADAAVTEAATITKGA